MEKLFVFQKAFISATSVEEHSSGTNVDFFAIPTSSIVNISAVQDQVILYFREANTFENSSASFAKVVLNVTSGRETAVVLAIWERLANSDNNVDFIYFNNNRSPQPVDNVLSIESINRFTTEKFPSSGGSSLPTGGVIDQVLTKQSATDGDADWEYLQDIYLIVENVSGVTLTKGAPVHVTGENASGNPTVILARADTPSTMPCNYIINETIPNGSEGTAFLVGRIQGVNTSSFTAGDVVYVGASGGYTTTKPTGTNLIQNLGIVTAVDASNGGGWIYGAGRSNDVPNLPAGKFFIGSASNTTESAYTLPVSDGSADQILVTNGSGAVSFQTPAASKSWSISMGGRYTMNTPNVHYYYNGIYGWNFYDWSGATPSSSFTSIPFTNWYAGIVIPDDFTTARVVGTIRTGNTQDYTVRLWAAPHPDGSTSSFNPTEIASQSFTGLSTASVKIDFSASALSLSATDVLFLTYLRSTGSTTTTRVHVSMTIYLT